MVIPVSNKKVYQVMLRPIVLPTPVKSRVIFTQYRPCGFPGVHSRRLSHPNESSLKNYNLLYLLLYISFYDC
jgi:hypothetical protein